MGTCLYTDEGNQYLINRDGKKYKIPTEAVLLSWSFPLSVVTSEAAVKHYPTALTPLKFRDGTLLINIADGRMYLASDNSLRHITSPAVLDRLGVTRDRFMVVSDAEINLMRKGEELN